MNPKLEEFIVPRGVKKISLQYYLDRSLYMSCKLKRMISSEMVIIDPKMIAPFYKKGVKVIIENDNYKVVNGNLVWINPKLKEFTIPSGVIEVSLSEVTDISNLEIIKTEAIQTTSNLKLNYIDFDKFPNLSTIYVTRNWYFFGKISIDKAILPDNFESTSGDVIEAKKVVIYEDNSERACFSNWYAPLDNSIVEEITIPNYINFVSLNKESLPGVKVLNYTGDFLGSVSLAQHYLMKYKTQFSKKYPIRLPNLQQINITFDTEEDLIKNLLSLNMLRQIQHSIEGFIDRNDEETTGKEYDKNRKLAEEQYQNIKLNFEVKSSEKENSFANDLNAIFNSCGDILCFFALMEYINAYCVNNNQDKIETVKEAARNLKNKKEVSICLYNLLCTIKPILLESDNFYCVDEKNVLFAEVIKNYRKLESSATYKYHISAPRSDLIGNEYGHCKLLNDFLFEKKESSKVLKELVTELEKMHKTLYDDIVSTQFNSAEKAFAKVKERLDK